MWVWVELGRGVGAEGPASGRYSGSLFPRRVGVLGAGPEGNSKGSF